MNKGSVRKKIYLHLTFINIVLKHNIHTSLLYNMLPLKLSPSKGLMKNKRSRKGHHALSDSGNQVA